MAAHVVVEDREFAFRNRLQTFSIVNRGHKTIDEFFADAIEYFQSKLINILEEHTLVKLGTCFVCEFEKTIIDDVVERNEGQKLYMHSEAEVVDFETNLNELFNGSVATYFKDKIDEIELRGSGVVLTKIIELNVQISKFEPFAGSSYIPLPEYLQNKKAIINVENYDQMCFKYAVLSALHPKVKNGQNPEAYKRFEEELDFTGISFPVKLADIAKFERQNEKLAINVYMFDEGMKKIRHARYTKEYTRKTVIHLLMLKEFDDEEEEGEGESFTDEFREPNIHYCWIKDLSKLLGKQISRNCRKKILCDRCFCHFTNQKAYSEHMELCIKFNKCQPEMPPDGTKIQFDKYKNELMAPFIIYADVESLLKTPTEKFCNGEKTTAYQQHEAYSVGYYLKNQYDDTKSSYHAKRGPTCIAWFIDQLYEISKMVYDALEEPMPMEYTADDAKRFREADQCHICGRKYTLADKRVRDHSHMTGKYRGSAHQACNLRYTETRTVPVVFHNLSHYDAHFIIKELATKYNGPLTAIPLNEELYISFTKVFPNNQTNDFWKMIKFKFIDSFRFMPHSLDFLASLLPTEKKTILHSLPELEMRKGEGEKKYPFGSTQMKLLERKGVFCYDYMDSWGKLCEKKLPPKAHFYSKLTECDISEEEYDQAKTVWASFNIETIGEYSDLYMQTDIMLLADVFENFRQTCYNIYGLDAAHYFTAPGLSFDAMLKSTKVEIELLNDLDMLLFVESGIRGGISQCMKRYAKANNKYMQAFDPNIDSNYLMYLDANNLYGHSMTKHLPLRNFEWSRKTFNAESIQQIADDSDIGYIFEVDLEYPQELHEAHKDYPMCAERRIVPGTKNQEKLLLTLFDKKKYVVHYSMLKLVLEQGLKLKKIHRVLQFEQSAWLQPYIQLNTRMRAAANNEFEKNFFKLMINAIFGKTMENVRNRVEIKLKSKWDSRLGVRKYISKPNFKKWTLFGPDFVAIHMNPIKCLMNKPIIIGMSILDISKVLMYDYYYNFLKKQYGENVEMMYTDTDSFILNIKTECFYDDMKKNIHRYDTSDYPEINRFNMLRKNKKMPGLFKDELNGTIMTEFVGLRSKMYAVNCEDGVKMKKAKGVKKCVLKKTITFNDYIDCIKNKSIHVRSQNTFRSKKHCMFSVRQEKIALSWQDNKRHIAENNIDTLPWGHSSIVE